MSKTPSLRLRLPLLETGDEPNAWGVTLRGLFGLVDDSQGAITVPVNGNVTLTNDNYVTNQARYAGLRLTGTGLAGNTPALVTIPGVDKWRIVKNDCAGDILIGTGMGLAATVRAGRMSIVLCDGTDTFVIDPTLDQIRKAAADLDLNGKGLTNLRAGVLATDAARMDQVSGFFADLAKQWATKTDGEVVAGQGFGAKKYALDAASSAAAAATFDPTNFYTKPQSDALFAPKAAYPTLDDFRTLAIQLAKVKGSTVGMAAGVADDFRDQTGCDLSNSTNNYFDSANNQITNNAVVAAASEGLASMTSNSATSGQTALATSEFGSGFEAYLAYDGNAGTRWASGNGTANTTVSIQRTTASRKEVSFTFVAPTDNAAGAYMPTTFTRWGSNDGGTTKATLLTVTGAPAWGSGESRTYTIPATNRGNFTTYGVTMTAGGSTVYSISSIISLPEAAGAVAAMDLRSATFTAQVAPTKASIFILAKALTGTITINTDLVAKISRNNGANYTNAALLSVGSYSNGYTMYEVNGIDISSQPSGTSITYNITTTASASIALDAVVLQWG